MSKDFMVADQRIVLIVDATELGCGGGGGSFSCTIGSLEVCGSGCLRRMTLVVAVSICLLKKIECYYTMVYSVFHPT